MPYGAGEGRGIEIDGQLAGWLVRSSTYSRHLEIEAGWGLRSHLYDWVCQAIIGLALSKSGAILIFDWRGEPVSRVTFSAGKISEVRFPSLDVTSTEAASIGITISAETVAKAPLRARASFPILPAPATWRRCDFRLTIGGIDCSRVSQIDSVLIRVQNSQPSVAPLQFEVAEGGTPNFREWHRECLADGPDKVERAGKLEFLEPTLKHAILTLTLSGLRVVDLVSMQPDKKSENISRAKVTLECISLRLEYLATK